MRYQWRFVGPDGRPGSVRVSFKRPTRPGWADGWRALARVVVARLEARGCTQVRRVRPDFGRLA